MDEKTKISRPVAVSASRENSNFPPRARSCDRATRCPVAMDEDLALALALQAQEEEYAHQRILSYASYDARGAASEDEDEDEDEERPKPRGRGKTATTKVKTIKASDGEADEDDVSKPAAKERAKRGTKDARAIMKRMLEHGLVQAGERALTTSLFKDKFYADLMPDGTIVWKKEKKRAIAPASEAATNEMKGTSDAAEESPSGGADEVEVLTFNTVTDFRLAVVRERNPERKFDNGWDWVKYGGEKLGDIKRRLPPEPESEVEPKVKREPKVRQSGGSTPKKRKKKSDDDDDGAYRVAVSRKSIPAREQRASRNASRGLLFSSEGVGSDLQMVSCEHYSGKHSQPFKITVTSAAELVMDFHAHLSNDEIAGLLGGVYDAATKTLRITRAIPARQLQQENAGVEVEIDLVCIPEIAETLEKSGERVVGWYHSHPVFATHPSMRDVENQNGYQEMFARDDEPFVGVIVGPYDVRNDSKKSDVRVFHCVEVEGEPEPYELRTEPAGCVDVPVDVLTELKKLADRFRRGGTDAVEPLAPIDLNVTPASLTEHWRDGATRLEKVESSLAERLPLSWQQAQRDAYVGGVVKYLKKSWGIV